MLPSLSLSRLAMALLLSPVFFLGTDRVQACPCDPVNETISSVIHQDGTPAADDPASYPYPVTALQLLRAIDASSGHLVILPSGKPLAEQKLDEQDARTLYLFDRNSWKEPTVSIQILQVIGWQIDVVNPPGARVGSPERLRVRGSSRPLKVVFAYPPRKKSEDPFQTLVIPLQYADLEETSRALMQIPHSRRRSDHHFEIIRSPSTRSVILIATDPLVVERCKKLIAQMEKVAQSQQVNIPVPAPVICKEEK